MPDFELNKAIASKCLPCDFVFNEEKQTVDIVGIVTKLGGYGEPYEEQVKYGEFNPSGNWNDLMPLLYKYCEAFGIDKATSDAWLEYYHSGNIGISRISRYHNPDDKPQRALAECLLKVLEAKNEN